MNIAKHQSLFSEIRMNRYINAYPGDTNKAIQLYKYNIQISQALYPIISAFEIALRNAIDRELSKQLGEESWLISQRHQFSDHPDMVRRNKLGIYERDYFFRDKLKKAEQKLLYRKAPVTHGKLLAELTFGFWVKFFDANSIKILKGVPLQAFRNKPKMKLTLVHLHLHSMVTLRNRISHSEPICFNRAGILCLDTIRQYEKDICEGLGWIDGDLKIWAEKMNFFMPVYRRICSL